MSNEQADPAFQELMQKMGAAVSEAETTREHLKTASPDDLDDPTDLLTRTIEGMNDQFRAEHFPEEHEKIAQDREERIKKEAATKDGDDDGEGAKTGAESKRRETPVELRVEEEGLSYEIKEAMARGENPFYRFHKIAEEFENEHFMRGFSEYLADTEPLWKAAAHKIMLYGMGVGARAEAA